MKNIEILVKDLSVDHKLTFFIQYYNQRKQYEIALIIWFLLGLFGVDRFYLKTRVILAYILVSLIVISLLTFGLGLGILIFPILAIWVYNLSKLKEDVNNYNKKLAYEIISTIKSTTV